MINTFSLRRVVAAFITLALICIWQSSSAQIARSPSECVVPDGGKSDSFATSISFKRPAWTICFANETNEPINYMKRWGPDPLDEHTVEPGQLRAHYCDPGRAECILPFYVEYDRLQKVPSQSDWTGSSLKTYQQKDDCMKCGMAANYVFIRDGNEIILKKR